jgi:hypothetical protein
LRRESARYSLRYFNILVIIVKGMSCVVSGLCVRYSQGWVVENLHKEGTQMFKKDIWHALALTVVALSLVLMGCSKPSTEALTKAEQALEGAKQKGAILYAEDAFRKAEDSLKKAKDQVTAKQYKEAAQTLAETEALTQQAVAGIEPGKAKMKEEAEKYVGEGQTALDDLKRDVADAIRKKRPVPREEVQAAIGKWEVDFTGLKDKLQSGQIREACDGLKALLEAVKTKREDISKLVNEPPKK